MWNDFLINAVLAGVGLSLAAGPLGVFVVWRRMAYFSDAVAHAAILGVALAFAFSVSVVLGTLAVALAIGIAISLQAERGRGVDTSLGVLAHSTLAIGLVSVSFVKGVRIDLSSYLFGDILTATNADLLMIWGGGLLVLALIAHRWQPMLTATLSEEIAVSAGISPRRERLVLTLSLALVVALSIKIVGALLIGALLIIPAATARSFSRSPEIMAFSAMLLGALFAVGGVLASVLFDTPTGPSIVVMAAAGFAVSTIFWKTAH